MTYTFYFAFASIWWVKGSHLDTKEKRSFLNDRLHITVNKVTEHLLSYIISHSQQEREWSDVVLFADVNTFFK